MLDVDVSSLATKKGMLAPRMTATERAALPAPANGLIVFQTNDVPPLSPKGFWYYDALATAWTPLVGGAGGWDLSGNGGTNPATNFLGTSDNQSFVLRTNAVERMRVLANGNTGIGVAAPTEVLDIAGAIRINGAAAATNSAGGIRFNPTTGAHDGNIDGTAAGWYQLENLFIERKNQNYQYFVGGCSPNVVTIGAGATTTTGTIQTPYSTFWEYGRHQFLYLASELVAAQICPNTDITSVGFRVPGSASTWPMLAAEIKLKNTTTVSMTNFDYTGLVPCWTSPSYTAVTGWNTHNFASPFQWNGTANLIVEYCFGNFDWAGNTTCAADNVTGYNAQYGLYCDACGGTGTVPCPHISGCVLTNTSNLVTCDGTFAFNGAQAGAPKRLQIRFAAQTGALVPVVGTGDYFYSTDAVMIGSPAWAMSGGPFPSPFAYKGPGTLSAENSVWAGGLLLSDHVFDVHFDGRARPEDADRAKGYSRLGIDEMVNYVERERHLPSIDGREKWLRNGEFSVDALNTQLWVTVEEQALYIKELNERTRVLEQYLIEKRLKQLK